MASTIKVDQIEGSTGSTVTIPTGQTLTVTDGISIGSIPTITVAKGGTNTTSYAAGDILYASGATTLTKLVKPGVPAGEVLTFATSASAPSWAAAAGGGKVGQVVSAIKTDRTSTSSVTAVTTGLSVTITPSSATSKILLIGSVGVFTPDSINNRAFLKFNGGNTATFIGDAAVGHETVVGGVCTRTSYGMLSANMTYLDSPATTVATTYSIYFWGDTGTVWFNQSPTLDAGNGNGASSITAMEILA